MRIAIDSTKNNMIFWISLKNWVDWCKFHKFAWTFFFIRKLPVVPLRDGSKNEVRRNEAFMIQSFALFCSIIISHSWNFFPHTKTMLRGTLLFDPSLRGTTGNFLMKKKCSRELMKFTSICSVFHADSEYHIIFSRIDSYSHKKLRTNSKKS